MLVLTRRTGEEIMIAGNIRVTVVAVQGDKVRLGVTAPKDVTIDRREIHERRQHLIADPSILNQPKKGVWNPDLVQKA
jgi:carbon storage regulator